MKTPPHSNRTQTPSHPMATAHRRHPTAKAEADTMVALQVKPSWLTCLTALKHVVFVVHT
eukprot:351532-Chlamydomonas_euryale.AAC.13